MTQFSVDTVIHDARRIPNRKAAQYCSEYSASAGSWVPSVFVQLECLQRARESNGWLNLKTTDGFIKHWPISENRWETSTSNWFSAGSSGSEKRRSCSSTKNKRRTDEYPKSASPDSNYFCRRRTIKLLLVSPLFSPENAFSYRPLWPWSIELERRESDLINREITDSFWFERKAVCVQHHKTETAPEHSPLISTRR